MLSWIEVGFSLGMGLILAVVVGSVALVVVLSIVEVWKRKKQAERLRTIDGHAAEYWKERCEKAKVERK